MEERYDPYQDFNFVFAREKMVYTGQDDLPNDYWKPYFSMSVIGNTYEILHLTEDSYGAGGSLIMSDTEYEVETNKPFFDALENGMDVLSLGYGIGLVVPIVINKGCELTVIEKYQQVIDLEENLSPSVELIMGDANDVIVREDFVNRKFDIIYSDLTEDILVRSNLQKLLKENGQVIYWEHLPETKEIYGL